MNSVILPSGYYLTVDNLIDYSLRCSHVDEQIVFPSGF